MATNAELLQAECLLRPNDPELYLVFADALEEEGLLCNANLARKRAYDLLWYREVLREYRAKKHFYGREMRCCWKNLLCTVRHFTWAVDSHNSEPEKIIIHRQVASESPLKPAFASEMDTILTADGVCTAGDAYCLEHSEKFILYGTARVFDAVVVCLQLQFDPAKIRAHRGAAGPCGLHHLTLAEGDEIKVKDMVVYEGFSALNYSSVPFASGSTTSTAPSQCSQNQVQLVT